MSKFASFGIVVVLFLLLSLVVLFGFFVFAPDIKAYRALSIELSEKQSALDALETRFDKAYRRLQDLQERERRIDQALHRHFDEAAFERYVGGFFKAYELRSISSEYEGDLQTDTISLRVLIASPVEYYRFIDALNRFEWVAEVKGTQRFEGVSEGIETHFTLKVYTKRQ